MGVGRSTGAGLCLPEVHRNAEEEVPQQINNTFGKRINCQGAWGEGILFPFLIALQDGSTISTLKLASEVLYDRQPLGSVTVKRDEEQELMMTICNQILVNTPVHKEPLSCARYTAPRTFGYRAQIKKLERHDNQFQQMMAPFHAASTTKVQNRRPADVEDKTQGIPLGKEETSSRHNILVKEQQPDSTTKPDVKPKEMAVTTPASVPAVMEPTL